MLSIADAQNGNQVQNFRYDPLDRLSRAWTSSSVGGAYVQAGEGAYNRTYQYDEIGNITQRVNEGVALVYGYDPHKPHAVITLTHGDVITFSAVYDENGNMISRAEKGVTYEQAFNVENRLEVVTATQGLTQTVTRFVYDGDGARVAQEAPDGTTLYVGELYEERLPPGTRLDLTEPPPAQVALPDRAWAKAAPKAT